VLVTGAPCVFVERSGSLAAYSEPGLTRSSAAAGPKRHPQLRRWQPADAGFAELGAYLLFEDRPVKLGVVDPW
jgi:hypothetical protein